MEWINKFGYDPKQLHHLLRVEEYIHRYISGESYERCLCPENPQHLVNVKTGLYELEEARALANLAIKNIDEMCEQFLKTANTDVNQDVDKLLDDVQYNIMMTAIRMEILKQCV